MKWNLARWWRKLPFCWTYYTITFNEQDQIIKERTILYIWLFNHKIEILSLQGEY